MRLSVIIQLALQMAEVMLFLTNNLSLLVSNNACTKVLMTGVHPVSLSFQLFAFQNTFSVINMHDVVDQLLAVTEK